MIITLFLLLIFISRPCLAYFGGEVKEQDLDLNQNLASEIQNAFLYSKEEVAAINGHKEMLKDAQNISSDTGSNRFNFMTSKPKYEVDLNKKTKEKIAYNSYINGQYEVAIKIYTQLVEEYPFDNYPKYCLALAYQKLKQYKSAKKIYFDLLKRGASNKEDVVSNLVSILSEESPKEALYLLTKLSSQNPSSGYFLAQKALILAKIGNHELAIQNMKEATQKEPNRVDYKFNLAVIYDQHEKFREALESYYEVVKSYNEDSRWGEDIPINQVISRIDEVKTFI